MSSLQKRVQMVQNSSLLVARPIGFCSGVERALKLARNALQQNALNQNGRVFSLGELIHNPIVVEELRNQGLIPIESLSQARNRTLVIRSHGCAPDLLAQAKRLKINIIDATCPNVAKVQHYAQKLSSEGYTVVVVGDETHPEVKSILAYAKNLGIVYKPNRKIAAKRIGVLAQTTASPALFRSAIANLLEFNPRLEEIIVYNTICQEALARQNAVKEIGSRVDMMLIVGGKNSANTRRLVETVRQIGKPVYHIEDKREIDWQILAQNRPSRIGIAAGTSTPSWVIDEIVKILQAKEVKA
ncbi:MAG: 4-hydroxy-3-methylbut-2-enyl diphosphate reductase [candidate division WOR-3 bacterium]